MTSEGQQKCDIDSYPSEVKESTSEGQQKHDIDSCSSDVEQSTKAKTEETNIKTPSKPDIAESSVFTTDFFRRKIESLNEIANLFSPEALQREENKCNVGATPHPPENLLDRDIRKSSSSHLVDQPTSHFVDEITEESPLKNENRSISLQESTYKAKKESLKQSKRAGVSSMINLAGEVITNVRTGNRDSSDINTPHASQETSRDSSTNFASSNETSRKGRNETSSVVEGLLGSTLVCCESFMSFEADAKKMLRVKIESNDGACAGLSQESQLPYHGQLLMQLISAIETEQEALTPRNFSNNSDHPVLEFYPAEKNIEEQLETTECTQRVPSDLNKTLSTCSSSRDLPMGGAPMEANNNKRMASWVMMAITMTVQQSMCFRRPRLTSGLIIIVIGLYGLGMLLGYISYIIFEKQK